jgi:hypothetical protein
LLEGAFRYAGFLVTGGKVRLRCQGHDFPHPECYYEDDDVHRMFCQILDCLRDVPDPTPGEWEAFRLGMLEKIEKNRRKKKT